MSDHISTEFIFLGTGTSSSIPHLDCLTAPRDRKPCRTCLSTLTPEGQKNRRRNTGAVLRIPVPNEPGQTVTVVIDAGKTFQAAAVENFPKYGLRRIDALLITHPHADAFNGLDDLRGWTLKGAIQDHIDIYASEHTFNEAKRSFPYLVSREFATGGGDVPEFKWHIIRDKTPFEIGNTGILITPFTVHHGRIFSVPPPPDFLPTPPSTRAPTPHLRPSVTPHEAQELAKKVPSEGTVQPYLCLGFKIQQDIVYISDVSHIPDDVWPLLKSQTGKRLPVLVLDCLHIRGHTSHLSLEQSYEIAQKINAQRCYLTGFSHDVSHEEYIKIAEIVEDGQEVTEDLTEKEVEGITAARSGLDSAQAGDHGELMWLRPAHDGLRLFVNGQTVSDETYDSQTRVE